MAKKGRIYILGERILDDYHAFRDMAQVSAYGNHAAAKAGAAKNICFF